MAKSLKFTLEVNGLDIPEKAQSEISKALNQTLMHKLGELDLMEGASSAAPHAISAGSVYANKLLINGGFLYKALITDPAVREIEVATDKFVTHLGVPNVQGKTILSM